MRATVLDRGAQRRPGSQQLALADEPLQRRRAHPRRQRSVAELAFQRPGAGLLPRFLVVAEQALHA